MTVEFTSLWDDASRDIEAEARQRIFTTARVKAAPLWPFLAAAGSRTEYLHREALAADSLEAAADGDPQVVLALRKALREDFSELHRSRAPQGQSRTASGEKCKACKEPAHDTCPGTPGCPCCADSQREASKTATLRALAIVMEAADDEDSDDSDAYYVVDEDSGKDVGGPYDSQAAAQSAIDAGDFDEPSGDLTTQEGPDGDDSDAGDDDGDSEDAGGDDDSDDDGGDDESGSDDDSDDDDSDDDNPFAKGSAVKTAWNGPQEAPPVGHTRSFCPTCSGNKTVPVPGSAQGYQAPRMQTCPTCKGVGHQDQRTASDYNTYPADKQPSNAHVYNAHSPKGAECETGPDGKCHLPHYDGKDPGAGPVNVQTKNHGYHGSLSATALEEGEDPLEWVEQWMGEGEGTPEKPDEHNEDQPDL